MNMQDYYDLFPGQRVYCADRESTTKLVQGMLEFNDTACSWAGPFNGNWAYYCIKDGHLLCHPKYKLPTLAEAKLKAKYNRIYFPYRFHLTDKSVMDDHKVMLLLGLMTKQEIAYYEKNIEEAGNWFTVEKPFSLYMCGNDDCSYSKFFATLEEAQQELALLEICQPLDIHKDIHDNGFVFTN